VRDLLAFFNLDFAFSLVQFWFGAM